MFAVVVGAGFFGVGGMIIAVPIVAIVYYIGGRVANYLVERRNLPKDTDEYILMDHIDLENNVLINHDDKSIKREKKKLLFGRNNKK